MNAHISNSNLCSRCGKVRVVVKTYTEKVGNSTVSYKITSCPDPDCQKIVNRKMGEEDEKRSKIKNEQVRREVERQNRIAEKRKATI